MSAEFYRDVLGMEIVGGSTPDHPLGATAFLSSRPEEESHEIALIADPAFAHVAFKVSSLAELRSFHARVAEKNIPIKFAFNDLSLPDEVLLEERNPSSRRFANQNSADRAGSHTQG